MTPKTLVAVLLLPLLAACSSDNSSSKAAAHQVRNRGFVKAQITRYFDANDNKVKRSTVTLEDPVQIQKLISFFPGAATGRQSPTTSAWTTKAEVRLIRADGSSLKIKSDYRVWSEANPASGDFPIRGQFRHFVNSLFP
jgi:hypothetical protein